MENVENINYIDIYARKLLQDIKYRVRQQQIVLSGDREKEVDTKMLEVIKDLCKVNASNTNKLNSTYKLLPSNNESESDRILCSLVLYYTGLYEDNLKLLNDLLDAGYVFGHKPYDLNLFALVKEISSEFDEEDYIRLLKEQSEVFKYFYRSLDKDDLPSEKEIIKTFKDILKKDEYVAFEKKNGHYRSCINHFLTKQGIELFGEAFILTASPKQKANIISNASDIMKWDEINRLRLVNLVKNRNYQASKLLLFKEELFNNFTDDEIIKIEEIYKDSNSSFDYYNMKLHEIEFDKIRRKLYGEEPVDDKNTIFSKLLRKLKKN